jgi:pimeloyl-ACP methyl ester carboxylesterase
MATSPDRVLRLADGRLLGYAEYGAPDGRPLVFFHGTPGSRLAAAVGSEQAAEKGVRVISVERPGYGISDPRAGRRITDWPDDVAELADHLGLKRFPVAGISGGGPYAAACAWKLPDRIEAAGIISGLGPVYVPAASEGMMRTNRVMWATAKRAPFVMEPFWTLIAKGTGGGRMDRMLKSVASQMPEPDREILRRPEVMEAFRQDLREALRQGGKGAGSDMVLYSRPWGFPLEEIKVPVHLWQGDLDRNVPLSMGKFQASAIPGCKATFIEGAGHLWALDHCDEITDALLPATRGSKA